METPQFVKDLDLDDVPPLEFFGVNNEKLNLIKAAYPDVKFIARGSTLRTLGEPEKLEALQRILESILQEIRRRGQINAHRIDQLLNTHPQPGTEAAAEAQDGNTLLMGQGGKSIRPKTEGQQRIVDSVQQNDIVFAVGPAGSGKTYVAVALAAKALATKQVRKIVLVRPAVEAGERLGFLPGDMKEKIDPYLRPLYDALEDMMPPERLRNYLERNVIEIAPLAFMRGRTLSGAFIILDEAQNASDAQLKMFLTRLGMESKIIVTGDPTQIDLPPQQSSGLLTALRILDGVDGIGIVQLDETDVVRHRLVRSVLKAYGSWEAERQNRLGLHRRD